MVVDWKRARARALAVTLSLAVMAVAGELAARRRFGAPWPEREPLMSVRANRFRGWEMVPGQHYTYDKLVRVNGLGLRGPEPGERADGERRILLLGDSFVYGQGAAEDETIPHYLALELAGRWPGPITTINGGHRAYATHQELGLLQEFAGRLAPDDVVVLWFWNDLTERDIEGVRRRLEASGPLVFDVGAPMEGWTRARWRLVQLARRSALVMWCHDLLKRGRVGDLSGEAQMPTKAYALRFARYVELFELAAERFGFRLHFAIVPDPFALSSPPADAGGQHPSLQAEAVVRGILARRGVHTIDLHGPLREWVGDGPLPVIPFDGHYLPEASRVMARTLALALAGP